jgi:polyribonucleotide nucleotidyltransferase
MFTITKEEMEWAGRKLVLETGKIARQADGAVVVTYGGTTVLCTVVAAKKAKPDIDFFPLTVHYQEKTFAVGKIPGGFLKRESKPSELETLKSRLIDRPIRPLFPEGFYNEVQVVCTVLEYDFANDTDIAAMVGASAALSIAGIPFLGPIAAARVGYIENGYVLNPTPEQMTASTLDLVVAGTKEGVLMVESEAKELSEKIMLGAVEFGHTEFQSVIKLIEKFAKKASKPKWPMPEASKESSDITKKVAKLAEKDLVKAYSLKEKLQRYDAISAAYEKVAENLSDLIETNRRDIEQAFESVKANILRSDILDDGKRLDGRGLKDIRPIVAEVGILPRAHGSALFTRGETQVLAVATLGTAQDEQLIDALEGEYKSRFLLHYNFPPYSVGETGRMGAPGRREIGHGKLAWRAINPLLPTKEQFPYTLRVVSEVTESNGSSSMATVCGSSLALMDAGVPMTKPIAGIAMGLVKEGKKYAVLSDILGDEDHLGDMDFKVAGTKDGITALQMDLKITSITPAIMDDALNQAQAGRLHILGEMAKALEYSREQLSEYAPKMSSFKINPSKIRDVIGSGGKVIREICETTGAKIDIEDDGNVTVAGLTQKAMDEAVKMIQDIACDPETGKIYEGKVVKIAEFGAFVNFMGSRDGLVHISELAPTRVQKTEDVVKVGDIVQVKVLGVDDRGKIKLSMKAVNQG